MDVVKNRAWFLSISAALIVIGLAVLALPPHLNLGIDFTAGSSFDIEFQDADPGTEQVRGALFAAGHDDAIIQKAGEGTFFVRTRELGTSGIAPIEEALGNRVSEDFTIPSVTTVGKSVAQDTARNAIIAVAVASIFVMLYVMYAFRTIPQSYRYAIAAIIALMHDVLIVLGLFAILGRVLDVQVNAIFIVGILTLIGYSVNDTIVVFDRIRENVLLAPSRPFATTVNVSIRESLMRSLGTSITTSVVVLAMLLFGGEALRDFMIVLLAGVIVGTYSSIFIAAQVLVGWHQGDLGRIAFWRRGSDRLARERA